jgi:hypothetical protein
MNKVINVEDIFNYKEAIKRLQSYNMEIDKKKLLESPDLCREIIRITDYYDKMRQRDL